LKSTDFAKLYLALLLLAIVGIWRPGQSLIDQLSMPVLAFSLLAFYTHRSSLVSLRGGLSANVALFFWLIILLLSAWWPSGRFFIYLTQAAMHLLTAAYLLQQLPAGAPRWSKGVALAWPILLWLLWFGWLRSPGEDHFWQGLYILSLASWGSIAWLIFGQRPFGYSWLALAIVLYPLGEVFTLAPPITLPPQWVATLHRISMALSWAILFTFPFWPADLRGPKPVKK